MKAIAVLLLISLAAVTFVAWWQAQEIVDLRHRCQ